MVAGIMIWGMLVCVVVVGSFLLHVHTPFFACFFVWWGCGWVEHMARGARHAVGS